VAVVLVVLLGVWTVMFVGGATFWVAFPMMLAQNFAWSCFVAAGVNRIMRHAPGSLDVGVASNASMYNVGTMLGSLLGAGLLASVGAQWLPAVSAVAMALAIAVLGFEWHRLAGGQIPSRAQVVARVRRNAPGS
jgi:predicted MFS family arabinose efflux permease